MSARSATNCPGHDVCSVVDDGRPVHGVVQPLAGRRRAGWPARRPSGSRTRTSTQVTLAEISAAPSMWKPTSTTGRSVKYCTKPIAPWASSTAEQHEHGARRAAGAADGRAPRTAARG